MDRSQLVRSRLGAAGFAGGGGFRTDKKATKAKNRNKFGIKEAHGQDRTDDRLLPPIAGFAGAIPAAKIGNRRAIHCATRA